LVNNGAPHPLQRRYWAEDLVRLRSPHEQRRYIASQRSARIDPNPHQIDAVIFALERIPEGGCILADEVGLGKTIEAGLVIAQMLAEGAERILLVTPKALLGQWRQELFTLFSITAREWKEGVDFTEPGVYVVTRDFAGGERGSEILLAAPAFDLAVVDEAHEYFSNLYRRFDSKGNYLPDSPHAKMAGRLRMVLQQTPVILLTATPIQNSLTELWGLAQFTEPTGTLLGDLRTFREVFCPGDDRRLATGQEHELRRRTEAICRRTLRRQAQEFMKQPFVGRRAKLFEYSMSPEERALYDGVTEYLLEPNLCAFHGSNRRLLLIGFHRRMASSVPALTASLKKVAARLVKMKSKALVAENQLAGSARLFENDGLDRDALELLADLDDEEAEQIDDEQADAQQSTTQAADVDEPILPPVEMIDAELARVRGFIEQAEALRSDSKAQALVRAVQLVLERAKRGESSGKLVVFTESITTQNYLRDVLVDHGIVKDDEVTLFRGTNRGPRVERALGIWKEERLPELPATARPTPEIAVRDALVYEFRSRSTVFISTEAGAKGLNLQFAGTLINYDLPWNPQRVEQRIGRIHRYGQTKDVLVINFLARDNEAQRLTLDILMRKLDLFGTVLDASDAVLHESHGGSSEPVAGALGADFEATLSQIYDRARTRDEIQQQLEALRDDIEDRRDRFEQTHQRTAGLIERHFDEQVKRVFRRIQDELPAELAAFDRELERVVVSYLQAIGAAYTRREQDSVVLLDIAECKALPEPLRGGLVAVIGNARGLEGVEPLHLGHMLVKAALDEARDRSAIPMSVRATLPDDASLAALKKTRARLRLVRVKYVGFQRLDDLIALVVLEHNGELLAVEDSRRLLSEGLFCECERLDVDVSDEDLDDALEELLFMSQEEVAGREEHRFASRVRQIEGSIEDRERVVERQRVEALARVDEAERKRDAAVGADARTKAEAALVRRTASLETLETELLRLRSRDDENYERWMSDAHARRARAPEIETLVEAELELV
jgi:hypothetical protein